MAQFCDNCEHEMKRTRTVYEDGFLVEYEYECSNCGQVEITAYGHWEVCEEGDKDYGQDEENEDGDEE